MKIGEAYKFIAGFYLQDGDAIQKTLITAAPIEIILYEIVVAEAVTLAFGLSAIAAALLI